MRKASYFNQSLNLLQELHKKYPNQNLGRHISMAFADYSDLWPVSDKEFHFALEKYVTELELDNQNIADEAYVNKIIQDAEDLLKEEEKEEDDYEY